MDTLLYKVGCILLFGFIFVQSFNGEPSTHSNQLIGSENQMPSIKNMEQKTNIIVVDAPTSSLAANETTGQ